MPSPPWSTPQGVDAVVSNWLAEGFVKPCLAADRALPPRSAKYSAIVDQLRPELQQALRRRGVDQLYCHQAVAIRAALAGRHTVISTPTASGKSLCFHLPVLDAIAREADSCALYLYPTKALSRDQEHSVRQLIADAVLKIPAMVFDGDTPGDARRAVRERGRIVLTNPDMLHSGILPNHTRWASLFQNLRYVILDEMHTYRGVFGSHMAHVLARLKRIARFHGSDPVFIGATATIGNPLAHASRLMGVNESEVELVNESGAPQSSRQFFLYNPPIVNAELAIRGSALKHAVSLTADLVRAKVPTIVFGQSRNSVEIMLKYLRQRCSDVAGPGAIMAYRGGYLPDKRRSIERGLRNGEILCVVATNALELGIDIGDLDAVVCVGYPGSVAATWQRFGRAGRREGTSIALMVCNSNAVDQYLAREPNYLLNAGAEEARIDPNNVELVIQHLKCAVFEAPFELDRTDDNPNQEESYSNLGRDTTADALDYLVKHGLVHLAGTTYHWAGDPYPASHVSLRNIGWDNFVIIDLENERTIAELDFRATHTMLHEQAIYQHDAEQYQVEKLDFENHKAFVRRVKPDYFTTALTYRRVLVIDQEDAAELGHGAIGLGDVQVIEKVTGYKKIKFFTHENTGYGDVHLPEMQMHTTSFWLTLPEPRVSQLVRTHSVGRAAVVDALRGAGAALETVSAMTLMCEGRDLGQTLGDGEAPDSNADGPLGHSANSAGPDSESVSDSDPIPDSETRAGRTGSDSGSSPNAPAPGTLAALVRDCSSGMTGRFHPTVFLFDAHPGGVGLSPRLFERAAELVESARLLIASCDCPDGCPACIGPAESVKGRKALSLSVLGVFLPQSGVSRVA
ncbi:MAG: DEAD/DEAH box helicase [Polyangiaceae bacterium]|nr:DEAD/DEAH box helicase [Polyangiaceae bacterium]